MVQRRKNKQNWIAKLESFPVVNGEDPEIPGQVSSPSHNKHTHHSTAGTKEEECLLKLAVQHI